MAKLFMMHAFLMNMDSCYDSRLSQVETQLVNMTLVVQQISSFVSYAQSQHDITPPMDVSVKVNERTELVRYDIGIEMHNHLVEGEPTSVVLMIQPFGDAVMDVATPILEVFASNELGDERLTIDPYVDIATLILELFDMDTDSATHL